VDSTALTVAVAPVVQQGAPTPAPGVPAADSQTHGSTAAAPAATAVRAPADSVTTPLPAASMKTGPIVGQGRTDFADSLFAIRSGETVIVHFDTSPARTRRADKFESIVRQTLRSVYGAIADTILAAVPPGQLAAPNELLSTLPKKGIHLTGPHGVALTLWPETRPGRDGPLVVAYRMRVEH
jgi:hypothetical protein